MNKEDLAGIHADWIEELDKVRITQAHIINETPEKEEILAYVKMAREDTGKGVVSFESLSTLIKSRFGYTFGSSTISEWVRKGMC